MKRLTVTAGIIRKNSGILLAQRKKSDFAGGLWEFPGGKLEPGESLRECLRRELLEELSINALIGDFLTEVRHTYDDFHVHLFVFLVPGFSGEILIRDHQRTAWVCAEYLSSYSLLPADIPVAEVLLKRLT